MQLPVAAGGVRKLLREIESSEREEHVLALGGAERLAPVLQRQFLRGGADPAALRLGPPEGADAYLHVLAAEPGEEDVALLRRARRARVPAIAVVAVALPGDSSVPYVLATDVLRVEAGASFPLEAIAERLASRLGESGAPLAGRIPLLRAPVCDRLIETFARKNGLWAVAKWIPGADLPVLAINQLRLVLRLAQAYGVETGRERLPELVATLGAGLGFRAAADELATALPAAGRAAKVTIAYAGTRAVGEAARARFAFAPTQRRDAGGRAAP